MHPDATLTAPGRRVAQWRDKPYGPIDWALVPDDIEAEMARLRAAGQVWDDPVPGQRVRTDGQVVKWWFGTPDTFRLPFLCADVTARELRVPTGAARQHRNGAIGVYDITVFTTDMETTVRYYQQLLAQSASRVWVEAKEAQISIQDWTLEILARPDLPEGIHNMFIRGFGELPILPEEEIEP